MKYGVFNEMMDLVEVFDTLEQAEDYAYLCYDNDLMECAESLAQDESTADYYPDDYVTRMEIMALPIQSAIDVLKSTDIKANHPDLPLLCEWLDEGFIIAADNTITIHYKEDGSVEGVDMISPTQTRHYPLPRLEYI